MWKKTVLQYVLEHFTIGVPGEASAADFSCLFY